jgi:archaellum component FlaC
MDLHPKLTKALKKIVSVSKEKEAEFFRQEVKKIIDSHLIWMATWVESNKNIFDKINVLRPTAGTHEDDIAMCQFAIEEWENEDRAVGMRYNALCQKFSQLMTAERKQILKEELDKQENKIKELVTKANALADDWQQKLKNHTYNQPIANALKWLANVTTNELKSNYSRWEKEKL